MGLILPRYLGDRRDETVAEESRLAPATPFGLRERGVNVYVCPACHKQFRTDHTSQPACTGPNETTDDHPMTVMTLL